MYAVSRTGITGRPQRNCPKTRKKLVRRLRKFTKLPIAVGIRNICAEQFAAVGKFAEAAVVGSAIVQTIESNPGTEAESCGRIYKTALSHQPSAISKIFK